MAFIPQPSDIGSTSLAAIVGAGVKNVQFQSGANVLPRKILLVGNYDPLLNPTPLDQKLQFVTSADQVGALYGRGFNLHRLAIAAFAGSKGVETWCIGLDEDGGAVQATGDITFDGPTTAAGTIYLYIGHDRIPVTVTSGTSSDDMATAVVNAINANSDLPVTAAINGITTDQVDITVKSGGLYGNYVRIGFNYGFDEELPAGADIQFINQPTGGAGSPDIDNALNLLGVGDLRNAFFFTDMVHGFTRDSTTYGKINDYNGQGNDFVGCYSKTIARPLRCLDGDTSGSLDTLIIETGNYTEDRTNGIVSVPGSPSHPSEIAATAIGVMARTNNNRAEESYIEKVLPNIIPGGSGKWNSVYSNRNTAVKNGISPTLYTAALDVLLQNVVTFYRPDDVPVDSNGYRSMRNISIIQNILFNIKLNFSQEKWEGISIVADTARVSNSISREKARDVSAVIDDLLSLTFAFEGLAWIFTAAFTVERLQAGGLVTIRPGGTGFNATLPVIFSGEGGIFDTVVQFDTSLAVLL